MPRPNSRRLTFAWGRRSRMDIYFSFMIISDGFNEQSRRCHSERSEESARGYERFFAALRMTGMAESVLHIRLRNIVQRIDHSLAQLLPGFRSDLGGFAFVAAFGVDFGRGNVADEAVRQAEYECGGEG